MCVWTIQNRIQNISLESTGKCVWQSKWNTVRCSCSSLIVFCSKTIFLHSVGVWKQPLATARRTFQHVCQNSAKTKISSNATIVRVECIQNVCRQRDRIHKLNTSFRMHLFLLVGNNALNMSIITISWKRNANTDSTMIGTDAFASNEIVFRFCAM